MLIPKYMSEYQVLGAKKDEFRAFNQLNFIDTLLEGLNQEEVD